LLIFWSKTTVYPLRNINPPPKKNICDQKVTKFSSQIMVQLSFFCVFFGGIKTHSRVTIKNL
jgi:hypothetical protein